MLRATDALRHRFDVQTYGEVVHGGERYPLVAVRNHWQAGLPTVLVTGGVHGYETSGVHGALGFLQQQAAAYAGRINLLVVPCVSPWGYETHPTAGTLTRWTPTGLSERPARRPNRRRSWPWWRPCVGALRRTSTCTKPPTPTSPSNRPAKAARDGEAFEPGTIPDGFYLVDDTEHPQPAFQRAILAAVERVTHIAPADAQGGIIGTPMVAHGVIRYPLRELGLCTSITGARFTTTTEVYPDSPRTSPEECIRAQVVAVCAALDFVLAQTV